VAKLRLSQGGRLLAQAATVGRLKPCTATLCGWPSSAFSGLRSTHRRRA